MSELDFSNVADVPPPPPCAGHDYHRGDCDACRAAYDREYLPSLDEPEEMFAEDCGDSATMRRLKVTLGSEVKIERVRWVVPDWIPAGALTLLAGREGLGKSTYAVSLCAQITTGSLADGEWCGEPRNVIYLHTEDSRAHTVAPRLIAAGADMKRVLFVDVQTELTDTGTLVLPADVAALERLIVEHDVSAVILDAATSAMSSELSGKDDRQVRQFLEPLAQLAARRECIVLGLCHFGKRDGADTGKLILGSIAWSQVARSVLAVAKDEESGVLLVTNTKGNLATHTRSMEATIDSAVLATEDGDAEVGVWRWIGETDRDARELLAGSDGVDGEDRNACEAWLEDYLTEQGRDAAKSVKAEARKQGFSDATVKRAAKAIGVIYEMAGFPRTSMWSLQSAQSAQPDHSGLIHEPSEPTEPTGFDLHKRNEPTEPTTAPIYQSAQSAHGSVYEPTSEPTGSATPATAPHGPQTPGAKLGHWIGDGTAVATVTPIGKSLERARTRVLNLLAEHGKLSAGQIKENYVSTAMKSDINVAVSSLINEGRITSRREGRKFVLELTDARTESA